MKSDGRGTELTENERQKTLSNFVLNATAHKSAAVRSWDQLDRPVGTSVLSTELMWNFVLSGGLFFFSAAITKNDDPVLAFCKIEPFLFAFQMANEYAQYFHDDDFVHRTFWTFFGSCLLGMVLGSGPLVSPNTAIYVTSRILAIVSVTFMLIRVAYENPELRPFCSGYIIRRSFDGFLWLIVLMVALYLNPNETEMRILWIVVALLNRCINSGVRLYRVLNLKKLKRTGKVIPLHIE